MFRDWHFFEGVEAFLKEKLEVLFLIGDDFFVHLAMKTEKLNSKLNLLAFDMKKKEFPLNTVE